MSDAAAKTTNFSKRTSVVTSTSAVTSSVPEETSPEEVAAQVFVPTNDAMYALYLNLCGRYSIRKPNKFLLSLMPPDESKTLVAGEADGDCGQGVTEYNEDGELLTIRRREQEKEDKAPVPPAKRVVKFAERRSIDLSGQVLGTSGICCLLELIRECPFFETLDLSPLPNLFQHDPFKQGIDGNSVMELLAEVAAAHPGLCAINLTGHSVGSVAVQKLTTAVAANANLVKVDYKMFSVNPSLNEKFVRLLDKNNNSLNLAVPNHQYSPSARMVKMERVDRKTSREQQELHLLLYEAKASFGGILTTAEMNELVLNAHQMQLGEVVNFCRGLRGDEENMFLLATGCLEAVSGAQHALLGRGDYFGEPLETAQYTAGRLTVKERGHCYRIPHRYVRKLADTWDQRVSDLLPYLKPVALLQSLPLWVIFRLCHDAKFRRFDPGEVAVKNLQGFDGVYIVIQGEFLIDVPAVEEVDAVLLAGHQLREAGVPTPTTTSLPAPGGGGSERKIFGLSQGDFFGEEAAVSKVSSSTVEIRAVGDGKVAPKPGQEQAIAIQLNMGSSMRHIVTELRAALQLQTKLYSRHDQYKKW